MIGAKSCFTDESRFSLECDTRRVLVWRDRGTRNNPAFVRERSQYRRAGGWMIMPDRIELVWWRTCLKLKHYSVWNCQRALLTEPIEHVWDMPDDALLRDQAPHATVRDLEIALLEDWSSIPQKV
ncbi:hypothetical protein TNCV_4441191 [Trichonephila clavipes]|nr:hypothetical protein TNCV_4441191 [Trichonephila clavipes]